MGIEKKIYLKIFNDSPNTLLPEAYSGDSGRDIQTNETNLTIQPHETKVVSTGLYFSIPNGYEVQIRPKSGLSSNGILVHFGTVDENYTGEVKIVITNVNTFGVTIKERQKIAQFVLCKKENWGIKNIERDDFIEEMIIKSESAEGNIRGVKGFGSSGT